MSVYEPDPITTAEYFRASELPDYEIKAGKAGGTIQLWRIGDNGEQWYRRTSRIDALHRIEEPISVGPMQTLVNMLRQIWGGE